MCHRAHQSSQCKINQKHLRNCTLVLVRLRISVPLNRTHSANPFCALVASKVFGAAHDEAQIPLATVARVV